MIHPNHTKTVPKPTQGIAMSCQTPEALPMCTLGSVKYVPKSHFQQQMAQSSQRFTFYKQIYTFRV